MPRQISRRKFETLVRNGDVVLGTAIAAFLLCAIAWLVTHRDSRSTELATDSPTLSPGRLPEGAIFVLVDPADIYDGDTAKVMRDGQYEKVRLCGIDAPEMGQGAAGIAARDELRSLVTAAGDRLWLVPNGETAYDRIVGELWGDLGSGPANLGSELMERGLVFYSSKYAPGCPSAKQLELISKRYTPPSTAKPWAWRKANKR